jgi:thymidylate kinase
MFIVIEGDNGTGKDTLAKFFQADGFTVITWDPAIKEREKKARAFTGLENTNAFLDYTKECAALALKYENALVIRSWISTISAAYADGKFGLDEAMGKAVSLLGGYPLPDYILFMVCDFEVRIDRINKRQADSSDDRTIERSRRYQEISDKLAELMPNWYTVNTIENGENKNPEEIYTDARRIIQQSEAQKKCLVGFSSFSVKAEDRSL